MGNFLRRPDIKTWYCFGMQELILQPPKQSDRKKMTTIVHLKMIFSSFLPKKKKMENIESTSYTIKLCFDNMSWGEICHQKK